MNDIHRLPNLAWIVLGRWILVCVFLGSVGAGQAQTPARHVRLEPASLVAGESREVASPLLYGVRSVAEVKSNPVLEFPIRVLSGPDNSNAWHVIVPPATAPGNYDLEISALGNDGQVLALDLRLTVNAVIVPKPATGRPPVILLNGYQFLCTNYGSTVVDSQGTFGSMASYLAADLAPVLFFNNCAYGELCLYRKLGWPVGHVHRDPYLHRRESGDPG